MQLRFAEVISRDDMVICFDLRHVFKAFYGSAKYGFRHYCIYNIVIFNWFNLKRKRKLFGNIKRYMLVYHEKCCVIQSEKCMNLMKENGLNHLSGLSTFSDTLVPIGPWC